MLVASLGLVTTVHAVNYNVTISLDAVDAAAGVLVKIDGISYSNYQVVSLSNGTHSLEGVVPANWALLSWYPGPNLAVTNPNSISTTLTVNGAGTLVADFGPVVTFQTSPANGGTISVSYNGVPPVVETFANGQSGPIKAGSSNLMANPAAGYTFQGWQFSGPLALSSLTTSTTSWNPTGPGSVTANFLLGTGNVLTVVSAHGSPNPIVGTQTFNPGTSVTCSVSSPVTEGSTTWICTGWTGTGSAPSSGTTNTVTFTISQNSRITWNWVAQYILNVTSAHGSPNPTVGTRIYNSGTSVICSVPSPVIESGVTWTCIGWIGTGSVVPSGTSTSTTFTITANSGITWLWSNSTVQRSLTIVSAHGSPNPPIGSQTFSSGTSITCVVLSPITEGTTTWTCTGWTGTGSTPSSGTTNSATFTINQDSRITWTWAILQYSLNVISEHGNPSPAAGNRMFNSGSSVTCSVTSPDSDWVCTGWTGTGSVPPSGTGTSTTFTLTANSEITWLWAIPQPSLTVISAHGSPNPAVGTHTYNSQTTFNCNVPSPIIEEGKTWTCIGWTGTGSVPLDGTTNSVDIVLSQDSTITWNWVTVPCSLIVVSNFGSPSPTLGFNTFDSGSSITCSVENSVMYGNQNWTCTGWEGTGSVPPYGQGNATTFTITEDSSITWYWTSSYIQHSLIVSSEHGTSYPAVGSYNFDDGSPHTFKVVSPVIDGDENWTCTGWSGTGSVPASGSGTTVSFDINEDSTLTWNWTKSTVSCRVSFSSEYSDSNTPLNERFHDYGSVITIDVPSVIHAENINYTCIGWSANSGQINNLGNETQISFKISSNTHITWHWLKTEKMSDTTIALIVAMTFGAASMGIIGSARFQFRTGIQKASSRKR
jgi:hypothetical protein